MSSTATQPDFAAGPADDSGLTEARQHWRAFEGLCASALIYRRFVSRLDFSPEHLLAIGAAYRALRFEMLDAGSLYASNTRKTDRFLLATAFNLHFARLRHGRSAVADVRKA